MTHVSGSVLTEDTGPIRVIRLNRPDVRNAIDLELRVVLADELNKAMADDGVRVVVLTGAGGNFCSGGDISTMRRQTAAEARPRAEAAQRVIRSIWGGAKPVIAAVEGYAFGAGTALALACDRVVASSDAVFATSFTGVGLAGDMGIFASLPARVGPAVARQMLLLPRRLSGTEAHALGMVDGLSEPGDALQDAMANAEKIAAGPPLAMRTIKSMLAAWPRDPFEVLAAEIEAQTTLFDTEDFAEGLAAFHARRPPEFQGK